MDKMSDYWRSAAAVYRSWRTGKKSLSEMTDGDLNMFDDYLHIVLVGREFRRLELETTPRRKMRFSLRWIALIPAGFVFLMLIYSMIRGLF